jgi:glycogen debranching enzyme
MQSSRLKNEYIARAKKIFESNLIEGYSKWKKTPYKFIAPAKKEYVYQFLWDTAFHAIVLSNFDTEWAKNEIRNHLLGQWDNGFIPHIIFWKAQTHNLPHWAFLESKPSLRPQTSALTQPPILGIAVEHIYEKDGDKEFLKEILPKLSKHYRWIIGNRDPDKDNLVSIISPNESGMDELPVFQIVSGFKGRNLMQLHYSFRKPDILNQRYGFNSDKILAADYFNVEEVLFNTTLIENARSLERLFKEIGNNKESEFFKKIAEKSEAAMFEKLWDEDDGIFYSVYSKNETKAKVKTVASLIPIFLQNLPKDKLDKLITLHLLNPDEFWTKYPVPTVAQNEIYYSPLEFPEYKHGIKGKVLNKVYLTFYKELKMLWRGPTWIATNWFIVKGLQKHGYNKIADKIIEKMTDMIEKWGFREYYNPETGQGYRRENFGWSTLIVDLL